jgi:hypothetical protein
VINFFDSLDSVKRFAGDSFQTRSSNRRRSACCQEFENISHYYEVSRNDRNHTGRPRIVDRVVTAYFGRGLFFLVAHRDRFTNLKTCSGRQWWD